jgi:hypothetical protein
LSPCGTGSNSAGLVRPEAGGDGGVGSSCNAVGTWPRTYGPAAAVVPDRNGGPFFCTVSPNSHRAWLSDHAALSPASREIRVVAVSAADSGRPRSTVAAVPVPAVRKFWVALRSPAPGLDPGWLSWLLCRPMQAPGCATALSPYPQNWLRYRVFGVRPVIVSVTS